MMNMLLADLGEGTGVGTTEKAFANLIPTIFNLAVVLGGFFVMYQLILGALSWINSAGDKDKITKAQKQMTNALVGLVILVTVWVLFFTITGDILGIFRKTADGNYQLELPSLFGN